MRDVSQSEISGGFIYETPPTSIPMQDPNASLDDRRMPSSQGFKRSPMRRVTITLDEELLSEIDQFMVARAYQNRSEVVRDLTRTAIRQAAAESKPSGDCLAVLAYVYNQSTRELPKRLSHAFHKDHDLSLGKMQAHLDQESCIEMTLLHGDASRVRDFAQRVIAERGVRHGQLMSIPLPNFGEQGAVTTTNERN